MESTNPATEPKGSAPSKERIVSMVQAVFLLLGAYGYVCVLFGIADHNGYPLPFFLGNTALFLLTLVCGLLLGGRVDAHTILSLLLGLITGAQLWINGLQPLPAYLYVHVLLLAYPYFTLTLFRNHNRGLSGGLLLLDCVKATFVYPFASFPALFIALFRPQKENRKAGKSVLFTLLGIGVAIVLGIAAVSLLSYDPAFRAVFTFELNWDDVTMTIAKLMLAVPLAALLFGAFASSKAYKLERMSSPETAAAFGERIKRIPAVVLMIPVAVLLAIYGIFFFTQWENYMSAFSGVLPADFTAAEYARSGFFELCGVAAMNTVLGVLMELFLKRSGKAADLLRKIANSLLAIATLVLIATALSKMVLYVRRFDLTVLRLAVSLLLSLIAIGFLTSLLAQWIPKVRVTPVLVTVVGTLLLVMPFCNVHARIAAYNVDAYLARAEQGVKENRIDTSYLVDNLGSAAVPDAIRLLASGKLDQESEQELESALNEWKGNLTQLQENATFELSLADQRALRVFNEQSE
ncbi:MAG: DUF4173 domain-containing protein [Clostridia bacterium]|nr:DUF4173 domain-containing protein [Clostridia bacterium]